MIMKNALLMLSCLMLSVSSHSVVANDLCDKGEDILNTALASDIGLYIIGYGDFSKQFMKDQYKDYAEFVAVNEKNSPAGRTVLSNMTLHGDKYTKALEDLLYDLYDTISVELMAINFHCKLNQFDGMYERYDLAFSGGNEQVEKLLLQIDSRARIAIDK